MPDDDFALAVLHYRVQFPDLASLGSGNPPAAWRTEYNRVAASGLGATLITSTSGDGTSISGSRNFDQRILLRALHARRMELDVTYKPFEPLPVDPQPVQPMGYTVSVGL